MFINIGEKIKNLRAIKGVTQEKFAQYLGADVRDVIKWESGNGYPNLELIPIMANYFDISTDELLCMELFSNEDKITSYVERFEENVRAGKLLLATETMREGLIHFPNNYKFKCLLMYALYLNCDRPSAVRFSSGEIISLSEDILSNCTDDSIRLEAKRLLSLHYYGDLNDVVRAREIAESLPDRVSSREDMLPIVSEGEDKLFYLQSNIAAYTSLLSSTITDYAAYEEELSPQEKIGYLELTLKISELIYTNGDYLAGSADIMQTHKSIATIYMGLGEQEKVLDELEKAARFAVAFDEMPRSAKHTSPLLSRLKSRKSDADAKYRSATPSLSEALLSDLLELSCFEPLRYSDKMKQICELLNKK